MSFYKRRESASYYAAFAARAQEHGLIVRAMGDSIALCPPLIISGDQIDEMLRRFGQALDDTAAAVSRAGLASVA